jgi:chromosome segregation ATPase
VYEVPVDVNLDGLHDELKVRMSLIAGLEQQNTELKNVLADAKESLSLSLAERERLNARVLELEREIRRVQAELASLQRKYDEILDSNAKQEARIAELEAEVLQLGGELPTSKAHILGDDFMDLKVQEWLDAHPDFEIAIEKVAPSSYRVGRPIDKVVSMKISGKNVLVRAGGGYIEVSRWLDEIYHEHQEGQQIRQSLSRSSKKRGSRSGSK